MSRRDTEGPGRPRSWRRRLGAVVAWYLIPGLLVLSALGYTYVALIMHVNPPVVAVEGTSMLPTLKTGELVFLAPADPKTLKKGDIIAVRVPAQQRATYSLPANVVHRIVRIEHISTGLLFITKGDNNTGNDVFTTPAGNVTGRLKFVVPALGYAFLFAQSIEGEIFFGAVAVIGLLYYLFGLIDDRRSATRDTILSMRAMLAEAQANQLVPREAMSVGNADTGIEVRAPQRDERSLQARVSTDAVVPPPALMVPTTLNANTAPPDTAASAGSFPDSSRSMFDANSKSKAKNKQETKALQGKKNTKSMQDKAGKKGAKKKRK